MTRLSATIVALLLTGSAAAAEITVKCPQTDLLQPFELSFSGTTMKVSDNGAPITLIGTTMGDPADVFGIEASGSGEIPMPPMAQFDRCVAEKFQDQSLSAAATDDVGYVANLCRLAVTDREMLTAHMTVTVTVLEPGGDAEVFVRRAYVDNVPSIGGPMELAEFPTRTCAMTR